MAPHAPTDDPALAGDGLSIGDVAVLLGVPRPTLRSWERRYGLPMTTRTVGGHRRYRSDELVQIRLMRDEIAFGRSAIEAARRVRILLDAGNPAAERVADFLAGCRALDDACHLVLEQAHRELGLAIALDQVMLPAMRQIGAWWETGRCDVGQERHATRTVHAWLAKITTLAPAPDSARWVLLSVGPRDLHTLGIEALAALLSEERTRCRVLGPRPHQHELVAAATATAGCAAVVVVSHLTTQRRSAVESILAVAATGVPVFFAGNAFLFPASRAGVPGTYLGESIGAAALTIQGGRALTR